MPARHFSSHLFGTPCPRATCFQRVPLALFSNKRRSEDTCCQTLLRTTSPSPYLKSTTESRNGLHRRCSPVRRRWRAVQVRNPATRALLIPRAGGGNWKKEKKKLINGNLGPRCFSLQIGCACCDDRCSPRLPSTSILIADIHSFPSTIFRTTGLPLAKTRSPSATRR